MKIKIGDRLPPATFRTMTADGPQEVSSENFFKGRKVVLFAVPGAFTPTCHKNHLPGFLAHQDAIIAKGVDAIAVTAVNDVFVMDAWAKQSGAEGKIEFLADGGADFVKAIGAELETGARLGGTRSKRYSMIIEDNVVKSVNVEDAPGNADVSGADALIKQL